jgi:hypothetical protein
MGSGGAERARGSGIFGVSNTGAYRRMSTDCRSGRLQLATLSARHAIPMISGTREIAEVGGLMSYGPNFVDAWHQCPNCEDAWAHGATLAPRPR